MPVGKTKTRVDTRDTRYSLLFYREEKRKEVGVRELGNNNRRNRVFPVSTRVSEGELKPLNKKTKDAFTRVTLLELWGWFQQFPGPPQHLSIWGWEGCKETLATDEKKWLTVNG